MEGKPSSEFGGVSAHLRMLTPRGAEDAGTMADERQSALLV